MATARVRLRGRFSPGTRVELVRVAHEGVLRSEGGEVVGSKKVDKDGEVVFTEGVKDGERYFIRGLAGGAPQEVRMRGRVDDADTVNAQAPVTTDRARLSDGSWADEAPEYQEPPEIEAAPNLGQHQVKDSVVQRSATPRGTAHPVDTDEPAPYGAQEDVPKGTLQMSDTETGRATPLEVGPQRQEDVPDGTWQRSDTPLGIATPLPRGGAVKAQQDKESSAGKERRGEPGRVAAEPIDPNRKVKGSNEKKSEQRHEDMHSAEHIREAAREAASPADGDTSGLDAQGQPISEDVAAASGLEPASKPAEPVRRSSSRSSRK